MHVLLTHFNLDIHSAGEAEILQAFHSFERCLRQINESTVRAHFKLVPGVLMYKSRPVHSELADFRRERNGSMYHSAAPFSRIDDLCTGFI